METCDPFDLVVVPFPFTDLEARKRRPALVLSTPAFTRDSGHLILAMVTTASHSRWESDVALRDWRAAGLPHPSVVRAKLFTLDGRFVLRRLGGLSQRDRAAVRGRLGEVLHALRPA
jgi:mRNA interferase MazF